MTTRKQLPTARAVADVTEGAILAAVEIAAPPERVFRAIASPEIAAWWGSPDTYRTTAWAGDVRVGGRFRSTGESADGQAFAVEGEFLEVNAPNRLVHTWKPDWEEGAATTVTFRLEPTPIGTRLVLRHTGFGARTASCQSHGQGWERVLGWLAAFAMGGDGTAPVPWRYFLLRLLPPRTTFAQDMTPQERTIMMEHVAYWTGHAQRGAVVAFGPVADPKGGWGVAILEVADEAELASLQAGDPAIRSERGFRYEAYAMPQAVLRTIER